MIPFTDKKDHLTQRHRVHRVHREKIKNIGLMLIKSAYRNPGHMETNPIF